MEAGITQIREAQKESWNKFSSGWKKWDDLSMKIIQPHGEEIIHHLNPSGSDIVLDIASGTGEPALTIAKMLTSGKVIMTDLSDKMLQIAAEKVENQGIKNIGMAVADACALPFADNSFDLISCRLGFMFFPDMELAAKEMARVLKPGGRIATTVWGNPEKNYWVTVMVQNIKKYIELPSPPKGAPGMFRCAEQGTVSDLFKKAGLKNTGESEINGTMNLKNSNEYWDFMTDIAAPFVAALSNADDNSVNMIKQGVINDLNNKYPNNPNIGTSGIVIWGEK